MISAKTNGLGYPYYTYIYICICINIQNWLVSIGNLYIYIVYIYLSPWFHGSSLPCAATFCRGNFLRRELAFKEAMDRHIAAMEAHAAEAVAEKDAWDCHVNDAWT